MADIRSDPVLRDYRTEQARQGLALAAQSDLFDLVVLDRSCSRFIAEFRCRGHVMRDGEVTEADRWQVVFSIPDDYLRRREPDPARVVGLLSPEDAYHPNIRGPFICVGHLARGTRLVDLVYQVFAIIAGQRVTAREDDCLRPEACPWVRANRGRFPVDSRPLKWRDPAAAAGGGR